MSEKIEKIEKIEEIEEIEKKKCFLFEEWIHEVTRVVQGARAKDEDFRKHTSDYSLNLLYVIDNVSGKLKEIYSSDKITLFVKLDKGTVQKLVVGKDFPEEDVDFTIYSNYETAKELFAEKLNPASAFINRRIKVEPMSRVYMQPRFTARSIITGNMILKFARQVPTVYVD